jgi:glycosyltransferase involved in cell wall biosynthesis
MKVSIIIPTRGNIDSLQRLIESIQKQIIPWAIETIIICNPANESLEGLLPKTPNLRFLQSNSIGANSARNLGINFSSGEILLFIDDDCEMDDPYFLAKHIELHEKHSELFALGGNYTIEDKASKADRAYFFLQQQWLFLGKKPGFTNDLILGGNLSLKKSALENLRFNESLSYGGTETDFLFQITKAGKTVKFFDHLKIKHHSDLNFQKLLKKAFLQGMGAAHLKQLNYYGVPLTNSNHTEATTPIIGIRPLVFCYERFFLAGFGYQLNGRDRTQNISFLGMSVLAIWEILRFIWLSIKEIFFYKIWNALELVLYSKK